MSTMTYPHLLRTLRHNHIWLYLTLEVRIMHAYDGMRNFIIVCFGSAWATKMQLQFSPSCRHTKEGISCLYEGRDSSSMMGRKAKDEAHGCILVPFIITEREAPISIARYGDGYSKSLTITQLNEVGMSSSTKTTHCVGYSLPRTWVTTQVFLGQAESDATFAASFQCSSCGRNAGLYVQIQGWRSCRWVLSHSKIFINICTSYML